MKKLHAGNYDEIRCISCGCAWLPGINPRTGEMEPGHPETGLWCCRYRPIVPPPWVAESVARHELASTGSNLPQTNNQDEIARRELVGGVPTREWPEAAKSTVPGPSAGPMVHALLRAVGLRNGHVVGMKGEAGP